jgi:hypothetical protein
MECAAGVRAGGTGRVAVPFRLSLFRAPLTATTPALFFVACLMTRELPSSIGRIDDAPGVAAALTMPLTLFHRQRQCLRSGISSCLPAARGASCGRRSGSASIAQICDTVCPGIPGLSKKSDGLRRI